MLRSLLVLALILSLGACASRLNPLNWFGAEREQRIQVQPGAPADPADPRPLVAEVTQLSVEPTTSGAIVRATGVTPAQGYFDAELRVLERTETTITYEFRAAAPQGNAIAGLQEIVAGATLSTGALQGLREITVIGQANRRSVSRR